jgi:hypothetical protein
VSKRDLTEAVVDNILRLTLAGGLLGTALLAPNAVQLFDKPLQKYLNTLDQRARNREISRIKSYMKRCNLISESYEHGLKISRKGRQRLEKSTMKNLTIAKPKLWDKHWRIVFYDIPESKKAGRDILTSKLRELGFSQLQRSVWIHPFPCREVITQLAVHYQIDKYLTYVETTHIDNEPVLRKKFASVF